MNERWMQALLIWHAAACAAAFLLVAVDKFQARRAGWRVPEAQLFLASMLGGWPGGMVAMMLFRHKTAKGSFQLKFVAAVLLWTAAAAGAVVLVRR